jgi:hypothetical protein
VTVDSLPAVQWYGNAIFWSGRDTTSDVAIKMALYNFALSAAEMGDVELSDPYLQLVRAGDFLNKDFPDPDAEMLAWFAQGMRLPELRKAQITALYLEHAESVFGV